MVVEILKTLVDGSTLNGNDLMHVLNLTPYEGTFEIAIKSPRDQAALLACYAREVIDPHISPSLSTFLIAFVGLHRSRCVSPTSCLPTFHVIRQASGLHRSCSCLYVASSSCYCCDRSIFLSLCLLSSFSPLAPKLSSLSSVVVSVSVIYFYTSCSPFYTFTSLLSRKPTGQH